MDRFVGTYTRTIKTRPILFTSSAAFTSIDLLYVPPKIVVYSSSIMKRAVWSKFTRTVLRNNLEISVKLYKFSNIVPQMWYVVKRFIQMQDFSYKDEETIGGHQDRIFEKIPRYFQSTCEINATLRWCSL